MMPGSCKNDEVCLIKFNREPRKMPPSPDPYTQKKLECVCALRTQLFATPWTAARQASMFMGFPSQEF